MPVDARLCTGVPAIVEAHRAGTKMHDLQETTCNNEVLKEVDHLVLVSKVAVEEHCSRECKDSQDQCYRTHSITKQQQKPAHGLNSDGDEPGCRWNRKSSRGDHGRRRAVGRELAEPAHEEDRADDGAAGK